MKRDQEYGVTCAAFVLALIPTLGRADDKVSTLDNAVILNISQETVLGIREGEIKFRRRDFDSTWSLEITDDGLSITQGRPKRGPLLGIDPTTKRLALFNKPGPTTTWKYKLDGDYKIKPPFGFRAQLFMKIGDEELRLSSDAKGTPILGEKADLLSFKREGP